VPIDQVYEKLNKAMSLRGFITIAVAIFDETIDELINRVFRKTDFAVKSVVDSLFETSGPLSELSIRLKVLLGLGIVEQSVFADIMQFIELKETLNNDEKDYNFFDLKIQSVDHIVFGEENGTHSNEASRAIVSLKGGLWNKDTFARKSERKC